MKEETKKALHRNLGFFGFPAIIIAVLYLGGLRYPDIALFEYWGSISFLMALIILINCFTQVLQYEPEETRGKLTKIAMIVFVLLLILGILVSFLYGLMTSM